MASYYEAELDDIANWLAENSNACRDASVIIDEVNGQLQDLKVKHETLRGDYGNLKELYHAAAISIEDLDRAHRVIDYLVNRCLKLEEEVMKLVALNKFLAHNPGENYEQEDF